MKQPDQTGIDQPHRGLDKDSLKQSLVHLLIYARGKDRITATDRDWLHTAALAVRERLIERWMETMRSYYNSDVKRVYYLSLEFLTGRLLANSLLNMGFYDALAAAFKELDLDLDIERIREMEDDAALGNGGLLGQGVGSSKQKLFYLPESHTDFIFAIIGEELGFVGATAIVLLFMVFAWRGLRIGLRAPEPFGAYLALGITVLIATQTVVNLGVVTGLLPTKGLPLPFISFGGSALVVTMLATGVLLNISQHANV
jgi:hypothetical protein